MLEYLCRVPPNLERTQLFRLAWTSPFEPLQCGQLMLPLPIFIIQETGINAEEFKRKPIYYLQTLELDQPSITCSLRYSASLGKTPHPAATLLLATNPDSPYLAATSRELPLT